MTVLDLDLPESTRAKLSAVLQEAELEWVHTDVPEGTAARTLRDVIGRGLDRLAIDPEEPTGIALITVDDGGQNEIVELSREAT